MEQKSHSNWQVLFRLVPFFRPYILWIALVLFGGLGVTAMRLIAPYLLRGLTDSAFQGQRAVFSQYVSLAAAAVVAGFLIEILNQLAFARMHTQVIRDLRLRLTAHIQRLPVAYLDTIHTGDLISRSNTDLQRVADFLRSTANNLALPILFFLAFGYCLTISWKLLLASCVLIPLSAVISNRVNKPVEQLARQQAERQGKASALIQDMIGGMYLVKAFNLQEALAQKYNGVAREVEEHGTRIGRIQARMIGLYLALRYIPQLVVPLLGGYLAYRGEISIGSVLAFNMLIWSVFIPIETLIGWLQQVRETTPSIERIAQILDQPPERTNPRPFVPDRGAPPVVFDRVHFQYDTGAAVATSAAGAAGPHEGPGLAGPQSSRPVLKNLSFQIPAGKTVALVGPSGCGKSTVLKLICGFYAPQSGQVRLMGSDLDGADLAQARAQLALVSQDTYLFPATIAENIGYGKTSASQDEIIFASQAANAHEFILEQPQGYDTAVGERGVRLSGGQRQRIAIARAILKNAPVLLLDEPTSALDVHSESLVQEALERFMQGHTALIVAHRLSTIRNADRILVLNEGEIVEEGTHDTLMQTDSLYRRLYLKEAAAANDLPAADNLPAVDDLPAADQENEVWETLVEEAGDAAEI